jgi:Family of unknown function (DUF6492)
MTPEKNRLSVVVPVALSEPGVNSSSWRAPVELKNHGRVYNMLATFLRMFRQSDLHEFLIICPDHEVPLLQKLVALLTPDPRYQVLAESALCPDLVSMRRLSTRQFSGWYIQQLLKLAVAARITTPFYLTLDSDILCCRPFDYGDLVRDGRAVNGIETIDDYNRIYTPEFARKEMAVKIKRQIGSERILGWQREPLQRHRSFSETPVVMHTGQVQQLTSHLEQRYYIPWQTVLSQNLLTWTEYTLYFGFLEMNGVLDSFCEIADCNAVLNLEKSAWQPRSRYRTARSYEVPHLFNGTGGPFIALQSWLQPEEWLPEELTSTDDYYRQLLAIVMAETPPVVQR